MRLPAIVVVAWLAVSATPAQASLPDRDGALLHADLFTDKQQTYTFYLRTYQGPGKRAEWLACSTGMGFPCGSTLTPDIGNVRYSPDGRLIAVALKGYALGLQGGQGLVTMPAIGQAGYATDAKFVELPGIASVAWSPDGKRLVAERSGNLVLLDASGSQQASLASNGTSPDWSSRGQIVFVRESNIWTVRPGQSPKQLTRRGGSSPSWSPDGRHLAFVRKDHVFTVRRYGRHLRRLTPREASGPVWSPSGRSLAFISNYDLYVARADGKKLRRLLNYGSPFQKDYAISIKALDWRPLPE